MNTYWVPRTKYQLVEWLSRYYHKKSTAFNHKRKDQLYAIFFNTVRRLK